MKKKNICYGDGWGRSGGPPGHLPSSFVLTAGHLPTHGNSPSYMLMPGGGGVGRRIVRNADRGGGSDAAGIC